MASRLQFQQTETGSAMPTQQSAPLQPGNIFTPPVQTAPAPLHQIEPELVGIRSRYVQSKVDYDALAFFGIPLTIAFAIYYQIISIFLEREQKILVIGAFTFFFLNASYLIWDHRRTAELLRNGDAVSATVISFRNGAHFMLVQVSYVSITGEVVETCVKIPPEVVKSEKLYPGSSFTLLVSSENPKHVVPYLLTTNAFSVFPVEATQVSENVSARIAEQVANAPVQIVGRLGAIETELLGVKTREIALSKKQKDKNFWSVFLTSQLIFIALVVFTKAVVSKDNTWIFPILICLSWWNNPSNPFRLQFPSTSLLKDGLPARAIIVDEYEYVASSFAILQETTTVSYTYEYTTFTGKKVTSEFTFPRRHAWQLGLSKGATFTVLYNIRNETDHKPYFQITDAEIIGAMGAKITPA